LLAVYNVGQLVHSGATLFNEWRAARAALALEDTAELGEDAQSVAQQLESQSDEVLRQVDEANKIPLSGQAANDNALPDPSEQFGSVQAANDNAYVADQQLPLAAGGEGRVYGGTAGDQAPRMSLGGGGGGGGTGTSGPRRPSQFTSEDISDVRSSFEEPYASDGTDDLVSHADDVRDRPNENLRNLKVSRPSSILGAALEANEEPWPGPGHQAHHIIPFSDERAADLQKFLRKAGINPNDAKNGVWLPTGQQTENVDQALRHESTFRTSYFDMLRAELGPFEEATPESIADALARVKAQLKNAEPRLWLIDD
jgi:hypothetical protein